MFNGIPQGASQIAQGAALQILNRKDMSLINAVVQNVSQPHIPKEAQNNPTLAWQGLVVDLTLQIGNETTTVEYPFNAPGASYQKQGWYISPDPLVLCREIESMDKASEQALATMSWHQLVREKSGGLILQLDPSKRKEAQQAQEIEMLRAQIDEMKRSSTLSDAKLDKLLAMLSGGSPENTKKEE